MANTTSSGRAVTQQYDFFNATPNGDKLFSVRNGIPLAEAFNHLTLYLSAAQSVVDTVAADSDDTSTNWAASHLLDVAYALAQSMHGGLVEHEKAVPVEGLSGLSQKVVLGD